MSELKPLYVPTPTTEEYGGFKVTKEYVTMDEFERGIKTADMVSVVRCRDCWHYVAGSCYADQWSTASLMPHMVTPYGFCAWGERREP